MDFYDTTASSGIFRLNTTSSVFDTATFTTNLDIITTEDWMPYKFFEYDPIFHKKYARYKIQIENMWQDKKKT